MENKLESGCVQERINGAQLEINVPLRLPSIFPTAQTVVV
jgi:hypothetical protein